MRAGARYELGLLLCSVAITALQRAGQVSSSWSRETEGLLLANSVPFKCVCPSPFQRHPQLQRGAGLSRRVCSGFSQSRGTACGDLPAVSNLVYL